MPDPTLEERARRCPPRCPSCGWLLVLISYREAYGNALRLWEAVCPNEQPGGCRHPTQPTATGKTLRVVRPDQAVYR